MQKVPLTILEKIREFRNPLRELFGLPVKKEIEITEWFPYIKPTRRLHDSGFYCFEVGYIANDLKTKYLIGYADHVYSWDFPFIKGKGDAPKSLNMDLLLNGCIRIFSLSPEEKIKWSYEHFAVSSMDLVVGKPNIILNSHERLPKRRPDFI